jgi:hypothetical protein
MKFDLVIGHHCDITITLGVGEKIIIGDIEYYFDGVSIRGELKS